MMMLIIFDLICRSAKATTDIGNLLVGCGGDVGDDVEEELDGAVVVGALELARLVEEEVHFLLCEVQGLSLGLQLAVEEEDVAVVMREAVKHDGDDGAEESEDDDCHGWVEVDVDEGDEDEEEERGTADHLMWFSV